MTVADVTVVIPTHDRVGLLRETLASVLSQESVSLAVVVVDDASRDGTWDWLCSIDDPRVRVQRVDPGRGGSAARNAGLREVRSPLVMFLDDDDLLRPGALHRLVGALRRAPAAIGAGGTYVTFGALAPGDPIHRKQVINRVPVTLAPWREELWGFNFPPGTAVWRTDAVRAVGGWDEALRRCEDLDVNLRLLRRPVRVVPDAVLSYRQHAGQIDDETRRYEWRLDTEVRERFVRALPDRERASGERILRSRPLFREAHGRYVAGDFRAAAPAFVAAFRAAPELLRSPILGPWMAGLLAKSLLAAAAPAGLRRRVTAARRDRRSARLSELTVR